MEVLGSVSTHVWNICWILIWPIMGAANSTPCPTGCRCLPSGDTYVTACVNHNFTDIPAGLPTNTAELYIKNQWFDILRSDSFDGLSALHTLDLTRCHIRIIEPNAFSGLIHLGSLDLRWNNLTVIMPYTFSGLFHLKQLILDNNDLHTIDNFAFHGLSLNRLSLEKNEQLRDIDIKGFHGCQIQEIYIYNASITKQSIQALRPLATSLTILHWQRNQRPLEFLFDIFQGFTFQSLSLNHNGIRDPSFLQHTVVDDLSLEGNPLGPLTFSKYPDLRMLRKLRLSDTGFHNLKPSYFEGMSHLRELYVSGNEIAYLVPELQFTFGQLDRLVLQDNPLHCNCELRWLHKWLAHTHVTVIGASCKIPRPVAVLRLPEDEFRCRPPNIIDITRSMNLTEDSQLTLNCIAKGDPAPTVVWELPTGHVRTTLPPRNKSVTMNIGSVQISSTSIGDAGSYKCVTLNPVGNDTAIAHVNVYASKYTMSGSSRISFSKSFFDLVIMLTVFIIMHWKPVSL